MATRYAGQRPWDSQPQEAVALYGSHPLGGHVVTQINCIPAGLGDGAGYVSPTPTSITYASVGSITGAVFNGSTSYIDLGDPAAYDFGAGMFSIEALVWINSNATQVIFGKDNESTQRQLFFQQLSGGGLRTGFSDNAGGYTLFDTSGSVALGQWVHVLACRTAASTMAVYIDGVSVAGSHALATATTVGATTANARIGASAVGGGLFSGKVALLRVYRGDVSALARVLAGDPWQLFAPQSSRAPSATLNAYSLTAASGSYSLSGQDASLLAARALPAGQGAYALTGQDAVLLRGYPMPAEQGAYSLTGQDATLLVSRAMPASQGSYALNGQDAGLLFRAVLSAEQGAYALTGQDATLTYTQAGSYTLTAAQGSYALTGQDVGLLAVRSVGAGQGSYALTGQDAGLFFGHLLGAAQGLYSLTGQDAGLFAARVMAGAQGAYALSGQDAALTYSPSLNSYSLSADYGSYGLTGQDAAMARTWLLMTDYGAYSLTGQDVLLLYSGLRVLSAPPLGHGAAMSRRAPAAGGRRTTSLSTRRR